MTLQLAHKQSNLFALTKLEFVIWCSIAKLRGGMESTQVPAASPIADGKVLNATVSTTAGKRST